MQPLDDVGLVPMNFSDVELLPTLDTFGPWMP